MPSGRGRLDAIVKRLALPVLAVLLAVMLAVYAPAHWPLWQLGLVLVLGANAHAFIKRKQRHSAE